MKKIIQDNYDSIVKRGLITTSTTRNEFLDKLFEEVAELEQAEINNDLIVLKLGAECLYSVLSLAPCSTLLIFNFV